MKQSLIKTLCCAENELVASYESLKIFQDREQNIDFKEFSIEFIILSIKKLHKYRSNSYSNLKINNLKQLKYFGILATNLISIFPKKLNPRIYCF